MSSFCDPSQSNLLEQTQFIFLEKTQNISFIYKSDYNNNYV